MGTVKVTNIEPIADNGTVTLGSSGDTIVTGSGVTANSFGLAEADMWRLTANLSTSGNSNTEITSNLERVDDGSFGYIGTGMTESSGVFTFPSTGIYQVMVTASFFGGLDTTFSGVQILVTTDNSTYDVAGNAYDSEANGWYGNTVNFALVDVTDTSNVKVKFRARHQNSGRIEGSTDVTHTGFMFVRLGDT